MVATHSLTGLADGVTHYFAVTAINGATESGYSNEVVYPETVTAPQPPSGRGDARTGVVYGYATGSAISSESHPLQYRFQWGDGTVSPWTDPATDGTVKAWKSWAVAGIYDVVAEARCALHPGVTKVSAAAPVSVVGGASLRLADSFSDGTAAGDPQWKALSGRWIVGADKVFTAARVDAVNRAVVKALAKFKAGRISAKLWLTKASLKQETGIIFAVKDAKHYRYVTLSGSRIAIGQVGDTAKVKGGLKASVARSIAANQWHRLRVDMFPNGSVEVFLGTSPKPVLTYRFADVPTGSIGCLAVRSVAYFDDYRVWDARVLR